jgi:TonB-linked SusC/RagA family outer membrane protein
MKNKKPEDALTSTSFGINLTGALTPIVTILIQNKFMKKKAKTCCLSYGWQKLFRIMKLSMILILVGLMQVTASVYSQTTKLSLDARNQKIVDVLKSIEDQSEFRFFYKNEQIDVDRKVDINAENKSVEVILESIFEGTDISYTFFEDKLILLSSKKANETVGLGSQNQQKSVYGKVTDEAGLPLPGVTVVVKGTTSGTVTNADGNYTLANIPEGATLLFSFVGMLSQEVVMSNQTSIDMIMVADAIGIEEVVAIGYGSQKKVNLTGAVATVQGEDLIAGSTPNLSNVLAGRMGGVTVQQGNGRPGSSSSIQIRGQDPLYVIDGIIKTKREFDALDANTVENISILKDAASAAVYGARASGGVVLVNTKIGNIGSPTINFKAATSIEQRTFKFDYASAYDQAIMWNDYNTLIGTTEGQATYYAQDELDEFTNNAGQYPSWLEHVWNDPVSQQYNLSVSGGTEKTKYYISAGYYDGTGFMKNITSEKQDFRINIESIIAKNLTSEIRFSYVSGLNSAPMWPNDNGAFDLNNLINGLITSKRTRRPYVNGLASDQRGWHPIEASKAGYIDNTEDDFNAIIGLKYEVPFIKGLNLNVRYSQHRSYLDGKTFNEFYTFYTFPKSGSHSNLIADDAEPIAERLYAQKPYEYVEQSTARGRDYQLNAMIEYDNSFGKHNFNGILVYEQTESSNSSMTGLGEDLFSSSIPYLFAASTEPERRTVTGTASESGRLSYIGRLSYNYAGKYLFETSFREDGSVNFPKDKRWGFFPSVSAGWRISDEDWFKNGVDFVDNLKLRGSVGVLGNDNVGNFQYLDEYSLSGSAYYGKVYQGIETNGIPNYNITWEKSTTYNAGLDFDFLQAFSFTSEVFYKKTTDILETRGSVVPGTFGGSMPDENWGVSTDKGFELILGYQGKTSSGLTYFVRGNMGYSIDEVLKTFVPENQPDYLNPIGKPRNRILGYKTEGIMRTQEAYDEYLSRVSTFLGAVPEVGWLAMQDLRGPVEENVPDGKVDVNDKDILSYNAVPRLNYGISLRADWKQFKLNALFQGIGKWDRMLTGSSFMSTNPNVAPAMKIDYWTEDNIDAELPRMSKNSNHYTQASDFWLRNAAFLRLKELSLYYSMPEVIVSKVKAKDISLSFTGNNLFTWSKMNEFDPEQDKLNSYPMMKSFTFRLSVTY